MVYPYTPPAEEMIEAIQYVLEATIEYYRRWDASGHTSPDSWIVSALEDEALDMLQVPEETPTACDVANATGEWPEWGFCRDWCYNLISDLASSPIDTAVAAWAVQHIMSKWGEQGFLLGAAVEP